MNEASGSRAAKFRRLLPRLVLDRPVFAPRQPIVVSIAERFDELCDVTLRLVHVSGRTYAEHSVQFGPDSGSVGLGQALNLPAGAFDVIATPPLAEFFTQTPVEWRLPLTIAPAGLVTAARDSLEERRAQVRAGFDGGLAEASNRDRLLMLVAAAAAGRPGLAAEVLSVLRGEADDTALARGLHRLGGEGFDTTPDGIAATAVALAALAALGDDGLDDLAAALLDKLGLCLALTSAAGLPASFPPVDSARLDPLAPLAWYLWGVGVADTGDAAVQALAFADAYAPPPFLGEIAAPASEDLARQWHAGGPMLGVARAGTALVARRGDAWQVRLGGDVGLCATGAEWIVQDGMGLVARHPGPAGITVPFWAFDAVERTPAAIVGRAGDLCVALATDGSFLTPRAHAAARVEIAGGAVVACRVGPAGEAGALLARATAALRDPPGTEAPPTGLQIDSRHCRARPGDERITIGCGDASLQLDLTPLTDLERGTAG